MTGQTENADTAAARLEAALERISQLVPVAPGQPDATIPSAEIAARLDGIIERLRAALDGKP
ncbi:MAG TPA: hypothetical protein VIZ17_20360 [Acetobacteraceae bacterium]